MELCSSAVKIVFNRTNKGLGVALNQGAKIILAENRPFVLLLDQDPRIETTMIKHLFMIAKQYYQSQPKGKDIGIIGSNYRSFYSGVPEFSPLYKSSKNYIEKTTVITSGSLLSLEAYMRTGPFREDFFIECIDLEYCLRLRRTGYEILCSTQPLMTHAAGAGLEKKIGKKVIIITQHKPYRYYYMFRNFIPIMRSYWREEAPWIFTAILNYCKLLIKIVSFEEERMKKIKAIFLGVRDGFLMKQ